MSKKLNIIEAMKMPIGTLFEVILNGEEFGCVAKIIESKVASKKQLVWDNRADTQVFVTDAISRAIFTPIQQPVSFMEVVNSDKKCRVEHKKITNFLSGENLNKYFHLRNNNYSFLTDIINSLSYVLNDIDFKKVIKEGEWYIEGSEDIEKC